MLSQLCLSSRLCGGRSQGFRGTQSGSNLSSKLQRASGAWGYPAQVCLERFVRCLGTTQFCLPSSSVWYLPEYCTSLRFPASPRMSALSGLATQQVQFFLIGQRQLQSREGGSAGKTCILNVQRGL